MLLAIAFMAHFAYGQFGVIPVPPPDATDTAIFTGKIWNTPTSNGSAADGTLLPTETFDISRMADSAAKRGDWELSLKKTIELINATRNSSYEPDVCRADNYLAASMLCWNTGRLQQADDFLCKSIEYMKNGKDLGRGCEARAVIFLHRMRERKLPNKFTYNDIFYSPGIRNCIMEIPHAVFEKSMADQTRKYDDINKMLDWEIKKIETQRQFNAK